MDLCWYIIVYIWAIFNTVYTIWLYTLRYTIDLGEALLLFVVWGVLGGGPYDDYITLYT